ncbi:MAG: hypothetical protein H0X30_04430 [Anaerolineae bacterium]|nr:hypothetical protein [Anaerolineae bacterium]
MNESSPSQNQLEGLIGVLAHARLRPGMYMDLSSISAIRNYFYGLLMPLNLLGVVFEEEPILVERGWHVGNRLLIGEMEQQGFTEQQIVTEEFSVLIIALIRQYNLSIEPIRQVHLKVRATAEKTIHTGKLDSETLARCEYELRIMSNLEKDLSIQ